MSGLSSNDSPQGLGNLVFGPGMPAARSCARHASLMTIRAPPEVIQEEDPDQDSTTASHAGDGGPTAPSPFGALSTSSASRMRPKAAFLEPLSVPSLQAPKVISNLPGLQCDENEGAIGEVETAPAAVAAEIEPQDVSDAHSHPFAANMSEPNYASSDFGSSNFESATINVLGAVHRTPTGQAATSFKGLDLSRALEPVASGDTSVSVEVESKRIIIIGSGWLGRALAKRLVAAGRDVIIGARDPQRVSGSGGGGAFALPCPALPIEDALSKMDQILILAIPHTAHASFASKHYCFFREDSVIVDVSNTENPGAALALQKLLPHGSVVKAFNTVSAYALEQVGQMSNPVLMSGEIKAKQVTRRTICEPLGFTAVDLGELESSKIQEQIPMQFFAKWKICAAVSLLIFAAWFLYCMLWYVVWPVPQKFDGSESGKPYYKPSTFSLSIFNKVFALTGFTLLGITYLPGALAGVIQLYRGTAKLPFPALLGQWMNLRKQLGLAAMWFIVNHAFMSSIRLSRDYAEFPLFTHPDADSQATTMTWAGEACMVFGIVSFSVFLVLMATSVPSIGQTLSYKEWMFVQSTLGGLGLLLGFVHCFLYQAAFWVCGQSCDNWLKTWPKNALPPYTVALIIPGVVLTLRLFLGMPGVYGRLMSIRKGL